MNSTGAAPHGPGSAPVAAQGVLFTDDLSELRDDTGYRGPTACRAAGTTSRQLDYCAPQGLVDPPLRTAPRPAPPSRSAFPAPPGPT